MSSGIPEGVELDLKLYLTPVEPNPLYSGVVMTLGGIGRIPDFAGAEWQERLGKLLLDASSIPDFGPARLMSREEVSAYKQAEDGEDA